MNRTGASELKEGGRHWNMHRTPTVDYAFCLAGGRHLVLDRADVPVRRGDVVVQLGNWHAWDKPVRRRRRHELCDDRGRVRVVTRRVLFDEIAGYATTGVERSIKPGSIRVEVSNGHKQGR